MTECRSCGEPIIWAKVWITGTPIPIDPDPVPNGNIVMRSRRPYVEVASTNQIKDAKKAGLDLYVSHFVTCKDGDKWRRQRPIGERGKHEHD